jgi:hypothetical protein
MPYRVIWSCGPTLGPDESRFSLFRRGMDSNSGLKPFDYAELPFNSFDTDPDKLDKKRNCDEWASFCGAGVKPADIYLVQYKMDADSFLTAYSQQRLSKASDNSFIRWLLRKGNTAAINYLLLAKKAERTQFNSDSDPWDTNGVRLTVRCEAIAIEADRALSLALPQFLKERYAFQAVKMYYYSDEKMGHHSRLFQLYENYLLNSKSIVGGWALVYYGMSQYNTNRRTSILLQAFDRTEEKKEFAYSRISTADLSALEKISIDPKLLLLINTVKAIKNKGKALKQLSAVYQYNPGSKFLPLLITREINKLENWLWSPEMLHFTGNYRPEFADNYDISIALKEKLAIKDRQYLKEVIAFMENITAKHNSHKIFMKLALIHLYNMQGDFVKAQQILQKMGELSNPSKEMQRLIEQVITTAQLMDINEPETQQQLNNYIRKLFVMNPAFKKQMNKSKYDILEYERKNESEDDVSKLYILLSHCFEKKGNMLFAGLLYNQANVRVNNYDGWEYNNSSYANIAWFDRYAIPTDIDKLLSFKYKKDKTQFEQLISPGKWGLDDLYKDLKGTILFRQKKYQEALQVFESMNPDFWLLHYEYKDYLPITTVTHTGKMIPSERTIPARYSRPGKMLIVKDIVNLLSAISLAKTNAEKAGFYYKLGNAYFNTSYNGKAWMMFSYGKSAQENYGRETSNYNWAWFDFYPNNLKYAQYYYQCSDAIAMYKKALLLATDKEFAAKCLLALSVCDKIRHDNILNVNTNRWANSNSSYYPDYIQKLKTEYGTTRAFKEAAIECPDLKNYLSKR